MKIKKGIRSTAIFLLLLVCVSASFAPTGGRVPTYAKNGMVVSSSVLASQVGRDVLKAGGNVIDAAVATGFALAVTYPGAGNIGGGGFMVYAKSNGEATTFDFREKAPLAAHARLYLDEAGKLKGNTNGEGILSAGVPGTVAGLFEAHKKYGKLPWKQLIEPSVKLAGEGFAFTRGLYDDYNFMLETWKKYPSTMKVMTRNGAMYQVGEVWKQPDLARSLRRIADQGRDGFYKGETAAQLARFMKEQGGIITQEDLATYQPVERKPVVGTYRGYQVVTMPPPSSGGVAMIEMLNMLEGYDLEKLGYRSADYAGLLAEVMKRAFADRAEFLGDPDFAQIPVDRLTSKEYAAKLRNGIQLWSPAACDSSAFGKVYEGGNHTTHYSVMDRDGNSVSVTYTIENWYGAQVVADGLGFFLNNEMGDFNPVPGVTNRNGQIGTPPNQIAPGKRMLSSMTPAILLKEGKPVMVIGAPGGRTIINTVMQVILNVVDHKMNIARAIEEPRLHHQWLPDILFAEQYYYSRDTRAVLADRGYHLQEVPYGFGDAMGIFRDTRTGDIMGAADSRGTDSGTAGY